jgi:hypothetical protein
VFNRELRRLRGLNLRNSRLFQPKLCRAGCFEEGSDTAAIGEATGGFPGDAFEFHSSLGAPFSDTACQVAYKNKRRPTVLTDRVANRE